MSIESTDLSDPGRFLALLDEEVGFAASPQDLDVPLDELAGWDSVMALKVLSAAERASGRPVAMISMLEARTLREVAGVVGEGMDP